MATLVPALLGALRERMGFSWIARQGCAIHSNSELEGPKRRCKFNSPDVARQYRDHAVAELRVQLRAGDVVAICGLADLHFSRLTLAYYSEVLMPLIRARGATLLLVGSIPLLKASDAALCRPTPANPEAAVNCEIPYESAKRPWDYRDITERWARADAFAMTWNDTAYHLKLFDLFCAPHEGTCGAVVPGTAIPAYDDKIHLSHAGSLYLAPFLCASLNNWGLLG